MVASARGDCIHSVHSFNKPNNRHREQGRQPQDKMQRNKDSNNGNNNKMVSIDDNELDGGKVATVTVTVTNRQGGTTMVNLPCMKIAFENPPLDALTAIVED
jgi:hypothetical protein